MQCITWKPWILLFIQLFYFQLFLNVSVNIFRNPFFIFHLLDKQHPSWWEKFPFFKYPLSLCTPMCVWVYSRGPPFFLSCLCLVCSTLQGMDRCLAVFTRLKALKGRNNLSQPSFLTSWGALIMNRS
jgi:hypothetical protein